MHARISLVVMLIASATHSNAAEAQRPPGPNRRFAADSFWTGIWQRGFSKEPDLVVEPRELITVGNRLVLLDAGTREVLILDATTGKLLKRLEARGSGPGEFKRPVSLAAFANGFTVLDQAVNRMSALSFEGKLLWDIPSPAFSASICAHSTTQVTWKKPGAINSIVVMDTSGRTLSTQSLPWPDIDRQDMGTQAVVTGPTNSGACVFARTHGPGFVIRHASGTLTAHSYVESVPEPKIDVKRQKVEKSGTQSIVQETQIFNGIASAMKAMVVLDTLIVQFAGATDYKYRLLDYYHLPSGRYIHSRKLRAPAVAVTTGNNGWFYISEMQDEYSGFFALRPSIVPPAAKAPARK